MVTFSSLADLMLQVERLMLSIKHEKPAAYLDVSQCTSQHTQIGGLLLLYIRDVFLQGLKALLQVCTSDRHDTRQVCVRWQKD